MSRERWLRPRARRARGRARAMIKMKSSNICTLAATLVLPLIFGAAPARGQDYDRTAVRRAEKNLPGASPVVAEKVALGKRLFFDNRLSVDEWLSCASCHDPAHGFSDPRRISVGVLGQRGRRHAPTLVGRGLGESQFWDGRVASLEEQVLDPILNPEEMGMKMETLLPRLKRDPVYRNLTPQTLAEALASYVRTIRSDNSPFDLFLAGWPIMMSDAEMEGLRLFEGKARCYICHSGNRFTDESFHNTGVAWSDGALQDEGRAAISGKLYQRGAFKTPTLREAGLRGPFMHDGSLPTLEDVIEYYDRGGNNNPFLDENIVPLHLSPEEKKSLLAFLRNGLSGSVQEGLAERP